MSFSPERHVLCGRPCVVFLAKRVSVESNLFVYVSGLCAHLVDSNSIDFGLHFAFPKTFVSAIEGFREGRFRENVWVEASCVRWNFLMTLWLLLTTMVTVCVYGQCNRSNCLFLFPFAVTVAISCIASSSSPTFDHVQRHRDAEGNTEFDDQIFQHAR